MDTNAIKQFAKRSVVLTIFDLQLESFLNCLSIQSENRIKVLQMHMTHKKLRPKLCLRIYFCETDLDDRAKVNSGKLANVHAMII